MAEPILRPPGFVAGEGYKIRHILNYEKKKKGE
jgi:hypothetical protein